MRTIRGLILGGSIMLLAAFLSLFFDSPFHAHADASCNPSDCLVTDTTLSDFVQGSFYATGLANIDDGAVQLLPMGLTSPWITDTYRLPNPRVELAAVIYKDTIYALGGVQSTDFHSEIFSATTYITGPIAPPGWVTAATLPTPMAGMSAVISPTQSGAILYVIGGYYQGDLYTQPPTSTISYHLLDSNGAFVGNWTNLYTALPNYIFISFPRYGLYYTAAVVRNGNLYVIGGTSDGTADSPYIYRFPILDATGTLGSVITETNNLPNTSGRHSAPAATWRDANGTDFLYVAGGQDGNTVVNRVPYTHFDSLDSTGVFTDSNSDALPNVLTAHGMVQGNGKIFLTGGQQGITRIPISDVHSALIDTTGALHYWTLYLTDWIDTKPLPEPRSYHASVINSGGEVYVIGGYGESGSTDTIFHGSTSGFGSMYAPQGDYLSRVVDLGNLQNVTRISVGSTISTGVTMTVQYKYGTSTSDFVNPNAGWIDLPGSLNAGFNITTSFNVNFPASKIQYRALFTSSVSTVSPSLNAFQVRYPPPVVPPDFAVTGLSAPPESAIQVSQTITYWVKDGNSTAAPLRRAPNITASRLKPPTTARAGSSITAPQTDPDPSFLFRISFYADPPITPTAPISLTGAMNCIDYNNPLHPPGTWLPFIWWNPAYGTELTKTPKVFYAQCSVPAHTKKFWAQIDTCDPNNDPNHWCQSYGYVLEQDEMRNPPSYADNIIGPVNAGQSQGGGGGGGGAGSMFLPFIRKQ
jgi:hypothetical protein